MSLSLGVHVGQQNLPMDDLRALWRKLDGAGVDWISAWDHFYEAPPKGGTQPHFEALATLGALAAETRHARIGCLVFYVGYRNPALLAKAATTLDHISGGRFELGLGAGWHVWEASAYGYAFPDIGTRLDMLEEAARIIRRMLTEERTTFSGKHFQVDDASCLPRPVQPRLPIWIGGVGEKRTLKIVADHADGWNAAYLDPAEFARVNAVLDHWSEDEGRDPASLKRAVNVTFNLALDEAGVKRQREQLAAEPVVVRVGLTGIDPAVAVQVFEAIVDAVPIGVGKRRIGLRIGILVLHEEAGQVGGPLSRARAVGIGDGWVDDLERLDDGQTRVLQGGELAGELGDDPGLDAAEGETAALLGGRRCAGPGAAPALGLPDLDRQQALALGRGDGLGLVGRLDGVLDLLVGAPVVSFELEGRHGVPSAVLSRHSSAASVSRTISSMVVTPWKTRLTPD